MRKYCWLIFVLMLCRGSGMGQSMFQNFNERDGLSSRSIRCIYKDGNGIMWLGVGNGLNRFDGNFIKRYPYKPREKDWQVFAIHPIDNDRKLLVGSSLGLLVFDKLIGRYIPDPRFQTVRENKVLAFKKDGANRLWLISNGDIHIFDGNKVYPATSTMPFLAPLKEHDFSFSAYSAFCWDPVRSGFWVGGRNSYFIDLKQNKLHSKQDNPEQFPMLRDSIITAIEVDRQGGVWYSSTYDKKLCYWKQGMQTATTHREFGGKKITDACNYLFIDRRDRLWISTWMFAAYYKDDNKPIKKIPFSQDAPYSIAYGFFSDALEDNEGNIWFATINGLSKSRVDAPIKSVYKLPSFDFFLDTGFAHANSIAVEGDTIVAAKEDGIIFYDTNEKTFRRYVVSETSNLVKNSFIMSVKVKSDWWFAGGDGIYVLRKGSQKLEQPGLPGANGHYAHFIFKDYYDYIWYQTDALYRYDPIGQTVQRFDGQEDRPDIFEGRLCQSFLNLRNGNILFGVNKVGLVKFDLKQQQFSVIPVKDKSDFYVRKMVEDSAGNLWCAVRGQGLYKMTQRGRIIDSMSTANGFPFDDVTSLAIDSRQSIWAANSDGMLFFKPRNKEITKVSIDLGKTLQDHWNDIYIGPNRVYAVMLDHIVVIDPFRFSNIPVVGSPRVTSIKIFEHEITDYPKTEYLELNPDQNFLRFQFTSPNHRDVPSLQYSYQLVGLDDQWLNVGRSLNAAYNNLRPGEYVFQVRSTDETGQWMRRVTSIKVKIKYPWWQTWWFVTICVVVTGVAARIIQVNYSQRRIRALNDEAIDYFANSVFGENSVNEICWDIARNCILQLHFEDCVVYLVKENGKKLVQQAAYGDSKNVSEHEILNPLVLRIGEGIVGSAAALKRPLLVNDTSKDRRYMLDDRRRMSELAVPILHEGNVIGVIDSEHSMKHFFTQEHVRVVSTIASISANKISEALAENQAGEKEMMLLEINKMLAESQLMALRAQMNPHFVFNCLNSIQECIVTEKFGEASKYLNKFSRLFRSVLNNSDKDLVTIEEEVEVLRLYLELESMRFENSFTYEIVVDEDLDAEEISLPSMLLQPYVENALWHGLMHKESDRSLFIAFERLNDDVFKCIIDDNGIGRRKSFEIKQFNSKAKRHKSKGLQITRDRLTLLERQGQHAKVEIIDKLDTNDAGSGTRVVIELSTFLNNT